MRVRLRVWAELEEQVSQGSWRYLALANDNSPNPKKTDQQRTSRLASGCGWLLDEGWDGHSLRNKREYVQFNLKMRRAMPSRARVLTSQKCFIIKAGRPTRHHPRTHPKTHNAPSEMMKKGYLPRQTKRPRMRTRARHAIAERVEAHVNNARVLSQPKPLIITTTEN